jgi:hypothetical protein
METHGNCSLTHLESRSVAISSRYIKDVVAFTALAGGSRRTKFRFIGLITRIERPQDVKGRLVTIDNFPLLSETLIKEV